MNLSIEIYFEVAEHIDDYITYRNLAMTCRSPYYDMMAPKRQKRFFIESFNRRDKSQYVKRLTKSYRKYLISERKYGPKSYLVALFNIRRRLLVLNMGLFGCDVRCVINDGKLSWDEPNDYEYRYPGIWFGGYGCACKGYDVELCIRPDRTTTITIIEYRTLDINACNFVIKI